MTVAWTNDQLVLAGEPKSLNVLGENMEWLAGNPTEGGHLHIDYFPDHYYLRAGSFPLTLAVE